MGESVYKVPGGKLFRVQLSISNGRINSVVITGDFFLHPEDTLEALEKHLEGHAVNEQSLTEAIRLFLTQRDALFLGASPADIAKAICMAV